MQSINPPHLNNCSRCPVFGTQDCPDEENYHLLTSRFSLRIAKEQSKGRPLVMVDPDVLESGWSMPTYWHVTSIIFHRIQVTASW
jgi:hypothetical protein